MQCCRFRRKQQQKRWR